MGTLFANIGKMNSGLRWKDVVQVRDVVAESREKDGSSTVN